MTTGMTGVMRHGVQLLKTYEKDGKKYYLLKPEGISQRVLAEEEDIRILFSFPLSDVVSFGRMPKWVRRKYRDVFQTIDDFVQHGFMQYMVDSMHGIAYTLKITMGCNFCCRYCYEAQRMGDNVVKMPKKIIREAIRKTAQFGGGSIAIHGGEPGLYPEGIEYAAKMVQKYKKLYKPAYLSLHLQTNGLAAYTALDIIKEYKIAVGISYDGRYQDKYRVFKDGSSTKDFVLKAIKIFKENNVPVMGISVVDREMDPAKVYEDNVKAGLTRFRLNPMYPVGHPILKDKMMPPERYVEMLNTAVDKMLANKEVHERRIEEYVGPMWGIKPVVCINIPCMAGLNFFDIDVEGNVAVCDAIPQLKIGNIVKDDWWDFMFHPKSIDFRFRHSELGKPCMTCPFKYHCDGGGCEGFLEQMGWPADKQGPFCPKSVFAKIYTLSYEDQLRLAPKSARKTFGPIILGEENA